MAAAAAMSMKPYTHQLSKTHVPCHSIVLPHLKPPSLTSTQNQTKRRSSFSISMIRRRSRISPIVNEIEKPREDTTQKEEEVSSVGVKAALSILRFYKSEISPLLPKSCRYVPSCSEYSMISYKKYGFVKGTILTAWRICRCNPLGGSGFDPPRWFDEEGPLEQ
ncbi:hypothetical protein Dimus_007391 [Dionaea muscipula]